MKNENRRKKKNTLLDKVMKAITWMLIAIIIISAFNIGKEIYKYYKARTAYKNIEKTAQVDPDTFTGVVDFDSLKSQNEDVCAWIYQKDTPINYPVLKGDDNSKYLHTLIDGTWAVSGSLFVDYRNADDFADFNSIIYGHHMHDGSMFKSLRGYTKEDGYYKKHKKFELITPEKKYHLLVFSSYIIKADDEYAYMMKAETDSEKQNFIDIAKSRSEINTTVDVSTRDKMVTLSTCAYDFKNARYIVVCKMVPWTQKEIKAGERQQAIIDRQNS